MRVLTNRDVKPPGRVLLLCPAFCLRESRWWLQLEVRKTSNLHYTAALHTISPVFTHHTMVILYMSQSELSHSIHVAWRVITYYTCHRMNYHILFMSQIELSHGIYATERVIT